MLIRIFDDDKAAGVAAAEQALTILRAAITQHGTARIIAATGASQFTFLEALVAAEDLDWRCVEMFHLDEYIGLPMTHPASFRKYLIERLISKTGLERYHLLDGESDAQAVCERVGNELNVAPINVAFVGIGENGHLAFNDPPADFETGRPYLIVNLDEACRRQQVGEGWFADLSEVPAQAVSMSIRRILKAEKIICIVPDERKAKAVQACLEGEVSPLVPASILRTHSDVTLYLDQRSASLLKPETITGTR
jgi:glucosamine-6-phosphate deaminase